MFRCVAGIGHRERDVVKGEAVGIRRCTYRFRHEEDNVFAIASVVVEADRGGVDGVDWLVAEVYCVDWDEVGFRRRDAGVP